MPSYNHAEFVDVAVRSALDQDAPFGIELVVADDASTDGTPEILRQIEADARRPLRLILRGQNLGMQANFADAWRQCRGKYIALLECDDYWQSPNKLAAQVAAMEADPSISLAFHDVRSVDAEGQPRSESFPATQGPFDLRGLLYNNYAQTCSVMYRAGVVPEVPQWLSSLALLDWPMNILHAARGTVFHVPGPVAVYRFHKSGVWSGRSTAYRQARSADALVAVATHANLPRHAQALALRRAASLRYAAARELARDGDGVSGLRLAARAVASAARYAARRTRG